VDPSSSRPDSTEFPLARTGITVLLYGSPTPLSANGLYTDPFIRIKTITELPHVSDQSNLFSLPRANEQLLAPFSLFFSHPFCLNSVFSVGPWVRDLSSVGQPVERLFRSVFFFFDFFDFPPVSQSVALGACLPGFLSDPCGF